MRFKNYSLYPHVRSGKQQTFERIRLNFKKLADREKKHCYLGTDDKCKEAAKAIFQDLRELTESESEVRSIFAVFSNDA